jgi:hypothetical protein
MNIKIDGSSFDRASCDADGDGLYLARCDSSEDAEGALPHEVRVEASALVGALSSPSQFADIAVAHSRAMTPPARPGASTKPMSRSPRSETLGRRLRSSSVALRDRIPGPYTPPLCARHDPQSSAGPVAVREVRAA